MDFNSPKHKEEDKFAATELSIVTNKNWVATQFLEIQDWKQFGQHSIFNSNIFKL
jgi:hypothetical protein